MKAGRLSQALVALGAFQIPRKPAPERRELHKHLVVLSMEVDKALRVIRDRQRRLDDSIDTGIGIGLQTPAVSRTASLRRWGCAGSTSFWRHG